ncbi:hypothetical protein P3T76_007318 [Phytophthora citrophthora]|uniref:Reverse transcriptase n=1 Tax=Phytophthora citrophthora TaxID=4793 RepID=A0AAD9LN51_9STRA|nr:hypothetical protein P3T76_007318 [Phytophthora citrophthora]
MTRLARARRLRELMEALAVANVQYPNNLRAHGSADDNCENVPSKLRCLERGAPGAGLHGRSSRRKLRKLRESQSGTETSVSAGQTPSVETLNVLTCTSTGLQFQRMRLENPPTSASRVTCTMDASNKFAFSRMSREWNVRPKSWSILSSMASLRAMAPSVAKTKKQRFEEQSWDSLKSSPYYEIPSELPKDKGAQHEIEFVPGTKYCVTRQWPLPREQVQAIDDFFESRRLAGQVRESKSPHSAPTFCVKKPQFGWRIVHAYN